MRTTENMDEISLNNIVKNVYLKKGISKKTGSEYYTINVEFKNGYVWHYYLTNEARYIMQLMLEGQGK